MEYHCTRVERKLQCETAIMSLNVVTSEVLSAQADNQFYDDIFCALKGKRLSNVPKITAKMSIMTMLFGMYFCIFGFLKVNHLQKGK